MFERFLIYARARRALGQGQFEVAIRLLSEPNVAAERRAEQLREKALKGLMLRGRRRMEAGKLDAAAADLDGVLASAPEFDGAASLRADVSQKRDQASDQRQAAQELRQEARRLAECGDLDAARRACADAAKMAPGGADQAAVERLIDGRQQAQTEDLTAAEKALSAKDLPALRRHLARLAAQSDRPKGTDEVTRRAASVLAAEHVVALGRGDAGRAEFDALQADRTLCPTLVDDTAVGKILAERAKDLEKAIRVQVQSGEYRDAIKAHRAAHPLLADSAGLSALQRVIEALADGEEARSCGDLGRAHEAFRIALQALDTKSLRGVVKELNAAENRADAALAKARNLATEGSLLAAREELVQVLEAWPMHEPLRRQMDILDGQARERGDRLQRARDLASEANLAQASALLLGLSGDHEEGREARMLLKDVQGRMDLASDGLAQVRRNVHGPASSREGLRHCLARLTELRRVQADLTELDELSAALEAEIRGLELLETLGQALDAGDSNRANAEVVAFQGIRAEMLRADRLDARFLDLADRVLQRADAEVHGARLDAAANWVRVVRAGGTNPGLLESRVAQIDASIEANRSRAEALLSELESESRDGDAESGADLIEAVRAIWADCPRLAKAEHRYLVMQHQAHAADEIEKLTADGDVRGAKQTLDAMPPTPGFLRTRIFDIKQGLARAQGLDHGFLLRVDEGGEYLVLREDNLTIGNVRDAKADVRVLANVAGLHARLKRSLSFHGGMEDRIVAEKGEVFVNGERVESAVLKSGDRVRLGPAFEFRYRLPGKRSLSASLHLKSGFQVAGTDKILLMKDRGRDGRILIGRAEDAHIRVPNDEAEVELHGATDGQIRVRYAGSGDIGGNPFQGAHPVTAGAWVRCGDTSFVLQPWQSA